MKYKPIIDQKIKSKKKKASKNKEYIPSAENLIRYTKMSQ